MYILGIETSCDDTAAAVIEAKGGFNNPSFSVLSNVSYSQVAIHKKFGGIVPNLASRAHLQKITPTVKAALSILGINKKKIDLIAVTRGPGLMPSLLVGVNFARALAYKWQKPVIGVNHIEGHILSNWLPPVREFSNFNSTTSRRSSGNRIIPNPKLQIQFPVLILIVSGGHTELVLMKGHGQYKIIGETLDDAAGECFDKTARILGLGFPGGPAIAALADKWKNKLLKTHQMPIGHECVLDNKQTKLPRPMINSKDFNFSFSGLKTAVLYAHNKLVAQDTSRKVMRQIMAYEIQEAIVEVLVAKTLQAVKKFQPKTVMIAGGVAANKRLRECLTEKIAPYKINLSLPELSYTTDNAAMIAAAGYFSYLACQQAGIKNKPKPDSWKKIEANANLRL